jgi:hypothetical protein
MKDKIFTKSTAKRLAQLEKRGQWKTSSVQCLNGHWKPTSVASPLDNQPCKICGTTKLKEKNEIPTR